MGADSPVATSNTAESSGATQSMALSKTLLTLGILGTIAGGAGAYVYFQGVPGMSGGGPMAQADVVPKDAIAVAYVSTDLQTWAKLEQFGTPDAQAAIAQGLGAALTGDKGARRLAE